jgi:hypothetical protein
MLERRLRIYGAVGATSVIKVASQTPSLELWTGQVMKNSTSVYVEEETDECREWMRTQDKPCFMRLALQNA